MDRYNHEGYPDPTACQALAAVSRDEKAKAYMPLVYIASPYAGDVAVNTERARQYAKFAVCKGCIPLAPHLLYPQFMDDADPKQRELGLRFALILLGKCDELWVFGERVSEGMKAEIAKARRRGMPIRYFNGELREVSDYGG
jgi:hypothetical protein